MTGKYKEILTIAIYGCVWGILELLLGGYLHFIHFPQKGYIMGGIAYTVLTIYVIKHKKVFAPIVIGLIAASFKIPSTLIFHVPIFSRSIVNPALAIIAEAASVTCFVFIVSKLLKQKAID